MTTNNRYIVGVFGTANTGKSTFINDVIAKTSDREEACTRWIPFGDDYRKVISEKGLKINREGNEECQQVIHDTLLSNIIKAASDNSPARIIMDRTIIDSFVYTYWHHRYGNGGVRHSTLEKMWYQVLKYSNLFDLLIYIPLEKCKDVIVVDDKFRDTNEEYRKQIDVLMRSVSYFIKSPKICQIYGTRDKRVADFINVQEYVMCNDRSFSNCKLSKFESVHESFL